MNSTFLVLENMAVYVPLPMSCWFTIWSLIQLYICHRIWPHCQNSNENKSVTFTLQNVNRLTKPLISRDWFRCWLLKKTFTVGQSIINDQFVHIISSRKLHNPAWVRTHISVWKDLWGPATALQKECYRCTGEHAGWGLLADPSSCLGPCLGHDLCHHDLISSSHVLQVSGTLTFSLVTLTLIWAIYYKWSERMKHLQKILLG